MTQLTCLSLHVFSSQSVLYETQHFFKLELSYMFLEVCLGTIYWSTSIRPGPVTSGTADDGIL